LIDWEPVPRVINETIKAVRDYLNKELHKAKPGRTLIDLLALDGRHSLEYIRTNGVGQRTILKFLGSGWKQWRIQQALAQLDLQT